MPVELSPELDAVLQLVTERFRDSEKRLKNQHDHCNRYFKLYRSYKDFRASWQQATPPDRDGIVRDAELRFGQPLFIPYIYYTIETILPRLLAANPRMNPRPRGKATEENIQNWKYLIESQQERINFELKLQDPAKSGLIYGLGVQKSFWEKRVAKRRRLVPMTVPGETPETEWQYEPTDVVLADDPNVEDVDIFDFFHDPMGWSMETCKWVVHRTWRDTDYVLDKFRSGAWANPGLIDFEQDIPQMGSESKYTEVVAERDRARRDDQYEPREDRQHEIWEYHDRESVITIVDGKVVANIVDNPWGMLPFQIWRPTTSGMHTLHGIGEVEPLEDLQYEMNTLRRSRRDNAAIVGQQIFAYMDGVVDPDDLQFAPGARWPTNGDPRELLMPMNFGEIPHSGYQEEASLGSDIEKVSGVSDAVAGVGGQGDTATGTQMVFAAAGLRVAQKTKRLSAELITPTVYHWAEMDRQKIFERQLQVPATPTAIEPNKRYTWVTLTPDQLQVCEMDWQQESGSTQPENVPQDRADAQALAIFRGDPGLDQRALNMEILRKLGIKTPELFMAPEQRVPPVMLDILEQQGVPRDIIMEAFQQALQVEQAQQEQSPNTPQQPPAQGGGEGENGGGPADEVEVIRDDNGRVSGARRKKANASSG